MEKIPIIVIIKEEKPAINLESDCIISLIGGCSRSKMCGKMKLNHQLNPQLIQFGLSAGENPWLDRPGAMSSSSFNPAKDRYTITTIKTLLLRKRLDKKTSSRRASAAARGFGSDAKRHFESRRLASVSRG